MSLRKKLAYTTLGVLLLTSSSFASKINVVNENKKPIQIKIEAEGDTSAVSKREITADHKSTFEVNSGQLNGKSYFSIKGDTSAFTPGGKCDHLSVEKNYKLTFQDDKVGTSCVAEEIVESK